MKRSKAYDETLLLIYRLAQRQPTDNNMVNKVLDQARMFVRLEKASDDISKLKKGLLK